MNAKEPFRPGHPRERWSLRCIPRPRRTDTLRNEREQAHGPRTGANAGDAVHALTCVGRRLALLASTRPVACNCWEKNSSAFFVLVSCSPERSIPCSVRNALVSAPIWMYRRVRTGIDLLASQGNRVRRTRAPAGRVCDSFRSGRRGGRDAVSPGGAQRRPRPPRDTADARRDRCRSARGGAGRRDLAPSPRIRSRRTRDPCRRCLRGNATSGSGSLLPGFPSR